jgi:hypothetical protein
MWSSIIFIQVLLCNHRMEFSVLIYFLYDVKILYWLREESEKVETESSVNIHNICYN